MGWRTGKRAAPAEPDTAFDVGSITKQFTATAILRLEMDGKLNTEDRLGKFLPGIAKSVGLDLPPGGIREDVAAITLHQMLSHTSGINSLYLDQSPSWKEYIQEILKQPLAAPPGTKFLYSNSGYDLLAKIVEVVSGESYERYLRDHLLLPPACGRRGSIFRNGIGTGSRGIRTGRRGSGGRSPSRCRSTVPRSSG